MLFRSPANGQLQFLGVDFQQRPDSPTRFLTDVESIAQEFWVIRPGPRASQRRRRRAADNWQEEAERVIRLVTLMNMLRSGQRVESEGELNEVVRDAVSKCSSKRIVGYVTDWGTRPLTGRQASKLTNAIFAFVAMDGSGRLTLPTSATATARLRELSRVRQAFVRNGAAWPISFAVGGWENSQHFSSVIADANGRRLTLIAEIDRILSDHNFDGVDIDWEYPITGGATEGLEADRQNYVDFLSQDRKASCRERV